jgi:aspartokinase
MKIVKFGGKSLANGEDQVLNIIEGKIKQEEKIAIVVSARGKQLMSWTIFLLLQPKWKLQTTFRV